MEIPHDSALLVDGDVVAYRAAAAAEKMHYALLPDAAGGMVEYFPDHKSAKQVADETGQPIWSYKEIMAPGIAVNNCRAIMEGLVEKFPDRGMHVFLSGDYNFRDHVWVTKKYKGNRDNVAKPKHLGAVRDYLSDEWAASTSKNCEADDLLGAELHDLGGRGIIISNDKDLDQIAGWHYNWVTGELYRISQRDADIFLFTQVLSGDPTDNVPGIAGLGPVKARRLLEDAKSTDDLLSRVKHEYSSRYGDTYLTYLQEQMDLVYIWRKPADRYLVA